jgi:hypothetical protein
MSVALTASEGLIYTTRRPAPVVFAESTKFLRGSVCFLSGFGGLWLSEGADKLMMDEFMLYWVVFA